MMNPTYKYPHKDRPVKIYRQKSVKWRNEHGNGTFFEKHYIHDRKKFVFAYIQQIVAKVDQTQDADLIADRYMIVINGRKGIVPLGQYYVEYRDKFGCRHTYKVLLKDWFDMRGLEVKLTCQEVAVDETVYSRVSGEGEKHEND